MKINVIRGPENEQPYAATVYALRPGEIARRITGEESPSGEVFDIGSPLGLSHFAELGVSGPCLRYRKMRFPT